MKTRNKIPLFAITLILALASSSALAGNTWDGGDGSNFWNWNNNWDPNGSPTAGSGNDIAFGGTTRLTPDNNYGDWDDWRNITFNSGAGSFTISGANIDIFGKIENNDDSHQFFNVNNFSFNSASSEINPVSGDLTVGGGGSIFNNANDVSVYGDNGHDLNILKDLSGTGKLIVQQYSIARIATNTTYTGNTEVNEGELWLEENGSISGSSAVYVGDGGATANYSKWFINDANGGYTFSSTININNGNGAIDNRTVGGLNASGINTYSGTIVAAGGADQSLTLFATTGGTVDYTGDITGDDKLYIAGGGTTRYSTSAKAHSGDAIITNTSTLLLNGANLIADTVDVIVDGGSTFDLNSNAETVEAVYGPGNVALGSAQLIVDHTTTRTLSGVVSGTGSLVKKGTGTLTFSGANSYSGETYPVGGTLQIDAAPAGGFTGAIRVGETSGSDAATLAIGAAGVDISNDVVVRAGSSATLTLAGNNTSGTATFSGNVSLSNNVTITSTAGGDLSITQPIVANANGTVIQVNNTVTVDDITGSGTIEKASGFGGVLAVTGNINAGDIFHNDGTIRIDSGGDISGGTYFLGSGVHQNDSTLELAAAGLDIDRTIEVEDAGGAEVKTVTTSAAGTQTLSGTVQLDNENLVVVPTNGSTLVLSGTLDLDFDGDNDIFVRGTGDTTLSGSISAATGGADVEVETSGTLTLSGDNTGSSHQIEHDSGTLYLNHASALGTAYADKIKVNGGGTTLRVGTTTGPASLGIQINGNYTPTLQIDSGTTLTVAGAIDDLANTANLTKTGDGTLLLNGANVIDGTTLVTAGVLGGTGSISGSFEVESGGAVSPGASVGTLAVGATTFDTNGVYVWEVNDFAGTYGTDPGWDKLDITGNLTVSSTIGQTFTVKITSLSGTSPGNAASFVNTQAYTQSIATVSGTISGFSANLFTLDTTGFSNAEVGGTWSIEATASTVDVVFTPAPAAPSAPVATAATNVTASSVYANWNAAAGATSYRLDVFQLDEDFADGNASTNLVWSGDTGAFSVLTDATLPDAVASTDESFLGTPDGPGAAIITTPSTETNEWRFSLGTSDFNPSAANHFGVILMSDTTVTGDAHASSSNWRGYYLRIGASGNDDKIQLRRKTGSGNSSIGEFTAGASGANGLQDGLNIRVTRSASGEFSLWTSTGFEFDQDSATFAGTLTNSTFDAEDTTHFGIWADMTAGSRQLYVDNIDMGSINYLAGYEDKTITPTTDQVTGLGANTPYVYRVRAANGVGTSDNSNYISVSTDEVAPTAIAATSVTVDSFDANWNAVAGALRYELDVFEANEDFADSNFTANPVWQGNTGSYEILGDAEVPDGNATSDGRFLGSKDSVDDSSLIVPCTETSEWMFSLASPDLNPSTANYFGAVLMASTTFSGDIAGANFQGYYLRIGDSGSDRIALYRKTGAGASYIGDFNTSSFSTGGLRDGLNIRVTRDSAGVFELFYASGFEFTNMPSASAGTLTNAAYSSSSYFGTYGHFSSADPDRRVYIDNIMFGSTLNTVSGFDGKSIASTSDSVTGLDGFTEYFYQVRVLTAGGTSDDSNIIAVETLDTPPTAIAATAVTTSSLTANWNSLNGASSYELDVFQPNEDFNDGDFSANPVWQGDTGSYDVLTDTTVPDGNATTDENFLASKDSVDDSSVIVPSTETSEWMFSLASPNLNPSTVNYFGAVLMANAAFVGDIAGANFQGYYLRIGDSSSDRIALYRKTGAGASYVGDFTTPSLSTGGLRDGMNIRITRDSAGVFELFYSTGFDFSSTPISSAGTLTNAVYSTSSFFGAFGHFSSPDPDRRVYMDNIVFGNSLNYVAGFNSKSVAGTSDAVSGLNSGEQYMYQVRAVLERGTTGDSNLITATTASDADTTVFRFK